MQNFYLFTNERINIEHKENALMIKPSELRKLLHRIDGLKYRLHNIEDVKIPKFSQRDCIVNKKLLEEAQESSSNRVVGHQRRLEQPYVKACKVLSGLVKDIIASEKQLHSMIQDKIDLINKQLERLGE